MPLSTFHFLMVIVRPKWIKRSYITICKKYEFNKKICCWKIYLHDTIITNYIFSIIYINKAKAAHGDPTLFENKVKDQLYHRTITIKSKSPFMDVTDSLKHGLSLVDQAKNETERIKEMIEKEK